MFEMEKRLTYLEKYVDELNEVIIEQGTMIKKLQTELRIMRDKSENSPVDPGRPVDEKPPHY